MNPLTYLQVPRKIALWIIAIIVTISTAVSLVESYRALYIWATNHQVLGNFAYIWPLMIDSFIVVGEATLFVAMADLWKGRARVWPWMVTLCGLAVSVAGNVGHVHTHDVWTRLTAAVAPIAASASLTVGMGVLKRVVRLHHSTRTDDAQLPPSGPQRPLETLTARSVPSMSTYSTATAELLSELPNHEAEAEPALEHASQPELVAARSGGGHAAPRSRSWSRERRARAIVKNQPEISGAELGRRLGVTPRHGQRLLQSIDTI